MNARRTRIAFWPHTANPDVASTRIRCLQVVAGLPGSAFEAQLFDANSESPDVLVLAKRYDEISLAHAVALRERSGTRLVLDLCDNHFYYHAAAAQWVERARRLRMAANAVDHVVVASDGLGEVVRSNSDAGAVTTIPDAIDAGPPPRRTNWSQHLQLWRLRRFLDQHPVAPGRRLLWFGNHGAEYADGGIQDLNRIVDSLVRHHREQRLTLTILSNSRAAYDKLMGNWPIPSFYLPWSTPAFHAAMAAHAVAVIPAQRNPFTLCKTNNRLATAFTQGLAVAADSLPAYEEFADLAVLDDWDSGLGALMGEADGRRRRVERAGERLQQRYSLALICRRWAQLVDCLLDASPACQAGVHGKEPA